MSKVTLGYLGSWFPKPGQLRSAKLLLGPPNASRTAELRPGIYVFDPLKPPTTRTNIISTIPARYVIYWPQEPVWNRFAGSSKTRDERVNCMRYLTCLTDQIRCLISPDHESALGLEAMQGHNLIDNGYKVWIPGNRQTRSPFAHAPSPDPTRSPSFESNGSPRHN